MPIFVGAAQSSFAKSDGGVGVSQVTTSQRDAISNPEAGQLIYNTTTGNLQIYDGSAWAAVYEPPMAGDGGNSANGIEPGNGYKYHTFTNSGSITFSGSPGTAQILVVGGGGGGGAHNANGTDGGGGGGAGGVVLAPSVPIVPGTYNITVGNGGNGGSANTNENTNPGCRTKNATFSGDSGKNGADSVFGASSPNAIKLTGQGGGGGGSGPNAGNQDCGGSGGGAGSGGSPGTNGAAGNQPNQNPSFASPKSQYGNPGGNAPSSPLYLGVGGGGAGGGGANGSSGGPGIGGPGVQLPTAWDASAIGYAHGQGRYYAGGGSGGTQNTVTTSPAPGGTGGGGRGHSQNTGPNSGAANGSGGAGGCGVPAPNARAAGAPGGKGIVVIRYSA